MLFAGLQLLPAGEIRAPLGPRYLRPVPMSANENRTDAGASV